MDLPRGRVPSPDFESGKIATSIAPRLPQGRHPAVLTRERGSSPRRSSARVQSDGPYTQCRFTPAFSTKPGKWPNGTGTRLQYEQRNQAQPLGRELIFRFYLPLSGTGVPTSLFRKPNLRHPHSPPSPEGTRGAYMQARFESGERRCSFCGSRGRVSPLPWNGSQSSGIHTPLLAEGLEGANTPARFESGEPHQSVQWVVLTCESPNGRALVS